MSPLCLVILTKPKNIYVPIRDFMISANPNLILPPIYVVGDSNNIKANIDFLDLKRYFEPIESELKHIKEKKISQKLMQNN